MLKVTFTKDAEPHELGANDPRFKVGDCVELSDDKAARWIRRGKAVATSADVTVANDAGPPALLTAPQGRLTRKQRRELRNAERLSDAPLAGT